MDMIFMPSWVVTLSTSSSLTLRFHKNPWLIVRNRMFTNFHFPGKILFGEKVPLRVTIIRTFRAARALEKLFRALTIPQASWNCTVPHGSKITQPKVVGSRFRLVAASMKMVRWVYYFFLSISQCSGWSLKLHLVQTLAWPRHWSVHGPT